MPDLSAVLGDVALVTGEVAILTGEVDSCGDAANPGGIPVIAADCRKAACAAAECAAAAATAALPSCGTCRPSEARAADCGVWWAAAAATGMVISSPIRLANGHDDCITPACEPIAGNPAIPGCPISGRGSDLADCRAAGAGTVAEKLASSGDKTAANPGISPRLPLGVTAPDPSLLMPFGSNPAASAVIGQPPGNACGPAKGGHSGMGAASIHAGRNPVGCAGTVVLAIGSDHAGMAATGAVPGIATAPGPAGSALWPPLGAVAAGSP
mmetsp:Transcript_93523/g.179900  ORF Transcript_93523/g.179900 Transcript_93523/m.179900 type:complete len:269 (-) Transcript_93523:1015-1821(-)